MKVVLLFLIFLLGCNSEMPEMSSISGLVLPPVSNGIPVNVKVTGLMSSPVTLSLNGEENLSASKDGDYFFQRGAQSNREFEVQVASQPADSNCAVENPKNESPELLPLVKVNCFPKSGIIVKGLISGTFIGTLTLEVNGTGLVIPQGSTSFLFPTAFASVSEVRVKEQPTENSCFFSNGQDRLGTPLDGRFDLWCTSTPVDTTISIRVEGIISPEVVKVGESFGNTTRAYTGTTTPALTDKKKRNVLEILEVPLNKRCYFDNSKNHFYSPEKVSSHTAVIKCEAKTACQANGVELPSTNGKINDIACYNDAIAYGGDFTKVGRQYGLMAVPSGNFTSYQTVFDRIHGKVNKIISDGKSGHFVAGSFKKVGNKNIQNIVRLDENLVIDPDFTLVTDGEVLEVVYKDNELFLFGNFSNIQIGVETIPRKGFAKINLSTFPEKVSPLEIPGLPVMKDVSATLIDWNIYFHLTSSATSIAGESFIVNKNSGTMVRVQSSAQRAANTLYWKDSSGKVWMINTDLGLVDPANPAMSHPAEIIPGSIVRKNRIYTLTNNNRLYQSSKTMVEVFDLSNISPGSTAINFGRDANGSNTILNAGIGIEVNADICFFPTEGENYIQMSIGGSTVGRLGMACFDTSGLMKSSQLLKPVTVSSVLYQNSKIVFNSQYYGHYETNALALILGPSNSVRPWNSGIFEGKKVNSIVPSSDGFIFGGDFEAIGSCSFCKKIARLKYPESATPTYFNTWFDSPFTSGEVTKLFISGFIVSGTSTFPGYNVFAFDESAPLVTMAQYGSSAPVREIANINSYISFIENNVLKFMDYAAGGFSGPVINSNAYGGLTTANGYFITPDGDSLNGLKVYYETGVYKNSLPVNVFDISKVKVTSIYQNACNYDVKTGVQCTHTDGTARALQGVVFDEGYTLFKGIENYLILAKENSAPTVQVLRP